LKCKYCENEYCEAITPGMPIEGSGPILIVLDKVTSEADLAGTYFGGKTGRLLRDILERSNLTPEDVTVTSSTRCMGDYFHNDRERNRLQFVQSVGNLDRFSLVIALGDEAFSLLTLKSGVKQHRGKEFHLHKSYGVGRTIWPTYGLDLVRRVPTFKPVVESDISRAISSARVSESIDWEWWDGQELPSSDVYAYDIETIDEKGEYTEIATQCAVAGNTFCYVSRPNQESAKGLAQRLADAAKRFDSTVVGHNSWQFDVPRTRGAGVEFPLGDDTMVLAYVFDETAPKSLESLCVRHLEIKGWKDEFEFPLGSEEFALYNARDVTYTLRLYRKLCDLLGRRKDLVDTVLRPAHIALSRMADRGIWINASAVSREREEAETQKASSLSKIYGIVGNSEFNPGSSKQVGEWVESSGVLLPETATGKPSTDNKTLADYVNHPKIGEFCRELLDYRKAVKTLSTYCDTYGKIAVTGDGRVHPKYSITRTKTGRTAASDTNVQNLPRKYKDFFGAPQGKVLVECDFSSIEFRLAAWVAQEETILARYKQNPDWDAHRFFAAIFYGKEEKEVTKEERQVAKSANFGLLYMGNAHTLVQYAKGMGLDLSLALCQQVYETWHRVFPGFKRYYLQVEMEILETNQSVTATGFARHFGDISLIPQHLQYGAIREGVNVKIQGLAAHIAFLAMEKLDLLDYPLVGFIHDAFLFEFDESQWQGDVSPLVQECMCVYPKTRLRDLFGVDLDIPLTIESKVVHENSKTPLARV
jgi:DNA polymerase I-like protein with 3'-5' exonuclease and polymerase domains/uracil-DNA glycosylase